MSYKILEDKVENKTRNLTLEIEKEEWKKEYKSSLKKISKDVKLPGFRPGKVPLDVIKKQIGEEKIYSDTINLVYQNLYTNITKYIGELEPKTLDEPFNFFFKNVNEESATVVFQYNLFPILTIKDYKKFNIQKFSNTVSNVEIESEFNNYIKKDIMLIPNEDDNAKVKEGENVNINFKGTINNVAFKGGTAENYDLIIGSHSFIPGFEEQIIGMKKGEAKIIDVTFPSNYQSSDLAGKKVQFEIKLNSIASIEKPELDKEYFSKFKLPNVENEKDFKKYIKEQIFDYKNYHNLNEFEKQFVQQLVENCDIDYYPDLLIFREIKRIEPELQNIANEKKISLKEYLDSIGYTTAELYKEGLTLTAQRNIKIFLGLQKIGIELDIIVTEDEINDYFEKAAKLYNLPFEDIKEKFKSRIPEIELFLYKRKIFTTLMEKYYL
ncbi:MAG: trigger factor [Mycoplasmataceae bacterium]|jgi:trigger factor|nr:trigger factor [Mycoplasmataceae bacterium]